MTTKAEIVVTASDLTRTAFASVKSGLGGLDKSAQQAQQKLADLAGVFGVGLSGAAVVAFVKGTIDAADNLNDLSQSLGIGIKELATWQLAANQSGASIETVAKGVKGLSVYMLEHGAALRSAGITANDANGALIQLADLFADMPDGVEKSALAVKLFGKSGLDMIPMLNQGSKGLAESAEKARIYGERMAAMAPQADEFNDRVEELALQSKIAGINIADYLLPGLIGMTTWLNDLAVGGEKAETALEFLSEKSPLFGGLVKLHKILNGGEGRAIGFTGERNALGLPISATEKAIADMKAFDAATDAYIKERDRKRKAVAMVKTLLDDDKKKITKAPAGSVEDYAMRINQAVAGAINNSAIVKSRELADQIETLDRLFFDSGLDADIYTSALAKMTGMTTSAWKESERLAQMLDATPSAQLEKAREDMQLLADAYATGRINAEQFNEAVQTRLGQTGEAMDDMTEFVREAARNMQDAMADGFFDIMQGNLDNLGRSFKTMLDRMVANAIAADLSNKLFGDFGKSGKLGGWAGDWLGKLFAPGYGDTAGVAAGVPRYAEGTSYVPRTGLALIHQGERIIPADQNRGGFGGNIIIHVNGAGNAQDVRRAAGQGAREALAAFAGAQRYA